MPCSLEGCRPCHAGAATANPAPGCPPPCRAPCSPSWTMDRRCGRAPPRESCHVPCLAPPLQASRHQLLLVLHRGRQPQALRPFKPQAWLLPPLEHHPGSVTWTLRPWMWQRRAAPSAAGTCCSRMRSRSSGEPACDCAERLAGPRARPAAAQLLPAMYACHLCMRTPCPHANTPRRGPLSPLPPFSIRSSKLLSQEFALGQPSASIHAAFAPCQPASFAHSPAPALHQHCASQVRS